MKSNPRSGSESKFDFFNPYAELIYLVFFNKLYGEIMHTLKSIAFFCTMLVCFDVNAQLREIPFGVYVPTINTQNKDQVALLYRFYGYESGDFDTGVYKSNQSFPIAADWSGNVSTCQAGTLNPAYIQAGVRQINFYRSLAGLSAGRVANERIHEKSQAAALVNAANYATSLTLTHFPSTTSACFSPDALDGASHSNLAGIGAISTPRSLIGYIDDVGSGNYSVGHRRWLLYPGQNSFSYAKVDFTLNGSVTSVDAVWIADNEAFGGKTVRPLQTPEYVAWPYGGYVPQLLMPISSNRWSFSCAGCDFTDAVVTMKKDGVAMVPPILEPLLGGLGDSTLVFKPSDVEYGLQNGFALTPLLTEHAYEVTVSNVIKPDKKTQTYSYTVRPFNVAQHFASKILPAWNIADMWWMPSENGWGIYLGQGASGAIFGSWFTYDRAGNPTWAVLSGGEWTSPTSFEGALYTTNGTPYQTLPYKPSEFLVKESGILKIDFSSPSSATMSYTLNGVTGNKQIVRQEFGPVDFQDGRNFNGMWWAGSEENGWGLSIAQQYRTLFVAVYVYDEVGNPLWFVMPGGNWISENSYAGTIYKTKGSSFDHPYDASQLSVNPAGVATLAFLGDESATLTYTLNGHTLTKTIKRMGY